MIHPPVSLMLEVTSHCNMHCTFCPSDDIVREKNTLSDELATRFIRESAPSMEHPTVMFNILGEPLLNKNIFDYVSLCEELGATAGIITNLTLLSEERLAKLFRHHNVHLSMSLHTPTDESLATRGYKKIRTFAEYLELACAAVEAKFRHRSRASIDIYLAEELLGGMVQSDAGSRLWTLFPDAKAYSAGWNLSIERLQATAADVRKKYPEFYEQELARFLAAQEKEIREGEIVTDPAKLPRAVAEGERGGWMVLPHVLFRRKQFGLWSFHMPFIRKHCRPDQFAFNAERKESFTCPGTASFGMLADGAYTLCCQDVEGEMDLGNIRDTDPMTALNSQRRADIIADCSVSRVCRRCAGITMVLDTAPLHSTSQTIDKFGFGWHGFEPRLLDRGGRWTQGNAHAYFFTRLDVSEIALDFYSPFAETIPFQMVVSRYDSSSSAFATEHLVEFFGLADNFSSLRVPLRLKPQAFYRVSLLSPTWVPAKSFANQDFRRLGLAVFSAQLHGTPLPATVPGSATRPLGQSDLVQIQLASVPA
jgi:organic radical activating enzyme